MVMNIDYSEKNYLSNMPLFTIDRNNFAMKTVKEFKNILEKEKLNLSLQRYFTDVTKNVKDYINSNKNLSKAAFSLLGLINDKNIIGFEFVLYTENNKDGIQTRLSKINGIGRYLTKEVNKDENFYSINLINFSCNFDFEDKIDDVDFLNSNSTEITSSIIQYLNDCTECGIVMINDSLEDYYDDDDYEE